jgi:OOP family OmpA-OmpF porin
MENSFGLLALRASKEKTTKRLVLTALLTGFVAAPAFAADSGAFIAVDLGGATYGDAKVTGGTGETYDDPGFIRIAGGYHFTPNLGVEAGYSVFGDSKVDFANATTTLKTSVFQVAAVGTYSINDKFDLFGKLGVASISAEESGTGAAASLSGSDRTTNLMFGVGGQYNFNQHWGIRLQYEDFGKAKYTPSVFGVAQPDSEFTVRAFSVGGVYNF